MKYDLVSGLRWTSISTIVSVITQLLQVAILARYLTAEEFGLVAITMICINIFKIFSDCGIGNAIIHFQNIPKTVTSSLYWLNIFLGLVCFFLIRMISKDVGHFYKHEEIEFTLNVMAYFFIINSFGSQFLLLEQKFLHFNFIAKVEIVSTILSLILSIYLAVEGYGSYALVYSFLCKAAVSSLSFFIKGMFEYRPLFYFTLSGLSKYFYFGIFQVGEKLLTSLNSQIDSILVGKFFGIEVLGIYNIAKQLVEKPVQIINPMINRVALPLLAKYQDDNRKFSNLYSQVVKSIAYLQFPIYCILILFSEQAITILFGSYWIKAAEIVNVLAIAMAFRAIGSPVGVLMLSKGRVKLGFFWNLAQLFIVPFLIFCSREEILYVTMTITTIKVLEVVPAWFFIVKQLTEIKLANYLKLIAEPFLRSVSIFVVFYIFKVNFGYQLQIIQEVILLILFVVSFSWINRIKLINLIQGK